MKTGQKRYVFEVSNFCAWKNQSWISIKLKFGSFPSKYHTMIQTANFRIIERWAEKILTANTIDDVFGEE